MPEVAGVFLPFPQGLVRSGSKIGASYKNLIASTNDAYCPTLRSVSKETAVPEKVEAIYEIVADGLDEDSIKEAMRRGIYAAADKGAMLITAGNYGGKLGKYNVDFFATSQALITLNKTLNLYNESDFS